MENHLRRQSKELGQLTLAEMDEAWEAVKRGV